MKPWRVPILLGLAVAAACAIVASRASADVRLFAARVYLDRTQPDGFIFVDDIMLAEEEEGQRQIVVIADDLGYLLIPFDRIRRIEMLRWLGLTDDHAVYQARVTYRGQDDRDGGSIVGRLDITKILGRVGKQPWFQLLGTREDHGERLLKIEFVD